jgi:hypothetical protein
MRMRMREKERYASGQFAGQFAGQLVGRWSFIDEVEVIYDESWRWFQVEVCVSQCSTGINDYLRSGSSIKPTLRGPFPQQMNSL